MHTTVTVGVITRPHGVRGELVVELRTDEPDQRFSVGSALRAEPAHTGAEPVRLTVTGAREHQGRWLVGFAEVADRTAAEGLRGHRLTLEVPADERPQAAEEFYDRQLVGLSVITAGGDTPVGTVTGVRHLPAQDLLEIDTGADVRLVPFVADLVPEVDPVAGRIVVADIAGLLADEEDQQAADKARDG